MLTDTGRHLLLAGFSDTINRLALLDSSLAEISGGSPAYARQTVEWNTPASGVMTNDGAISFDCPSAASVFALGYRASGGASATDYGWTPLGGAAPQLAEVLTGNLGTEVIECVGHGLAVNDRIVVIPANDAALPTAAVALSATTFYHVKATATADQLTISTSQGGAAVDFTAVGKMFIQKCVPETFGAQGILEFIDTQIVIDGKLI